MKDWKSVDGKSTLTAAIPALTIRTFVRAASAATLIIGTLVVVEFTAFSIVNRSARDLALGLWLIPFVALVIWSVAAAMCVLALGPRWLLALGQRLIRWPWSSSCSNRSGMWDDWLDSPSGGSMPVSNVGAGPQAGGT
jgi:hypothetical protein